MRALREHIYVGMKLHGQSLMTDGAKALRERLRRAFGDLRGDPRRGRRDGGGADARRISSTRATGCSAGR